MTQFRANFASLFLFAVYLASEADAGCWDETYDEPPQKPDSGGAATRGLLKEPTTTPTNYDDGPLARPSRPILIPKRQPGDKCEVLPFDLSETAFPPGTTITVTCPEGYEFVSTHKSVSSTCQRDNTWTKPQIGSCKKRYLLQYCPEPDQILNAMIAEVLITKHDSHGNRMRRDADWPDAVKVYQVVFNETGLDGDPQHRYPVGSTVRYACDNGHRLEGPSDKIFCQPGHDVNSHIGVWTKAPRCTRVCYAPNTPAFAVIDRQVTSEDGIVFPVNGYISYRCVSGFVKTSGDSTITCTSSGNWTGQMPMCLPNKPPPPEPLECWTPMDLTNAIVVTQVVAQTIGRHPIGGYIRYRCPTGYEFGAGVQSTITCTANGNWSSPVPQCRVVVTAAPIVPFECEAPLIPANGVILRQFTSSQVNHLYPIGGYIEYGCAEWHELFGERTITCLFSGWSSDPPTCQVTCPEPIFNDPNVVIRRRPLQALSPTGRHLLDSVFQLGCAPGYQIANSSMMTVRCSQNGKWHPHHQHPQCLSISPDLQLKTCSNPPTLRHGYVTSRSQNAVNGRYQVGATVSYSCSNEYVLVGNTTYVCIDDGSWRPAGNHYDTFCEATCRPPANPPFAVAVDRSKYDERMGRYQRGGHIRYMCESRNGTHLVGDDTVWCHEDGSWSSDPPYCLVPCGDPPLPDYAHVAAEKRQPMPVHAPTGSLLASRYAPGSSIRYECDDGYNLLDQDLDTVYCQNGGKWLTKQNQPLDDICLFFPNWMAQK